MAFDRINSGLPLTTNKKSLVWRSSSKQKQKQNRPKLSYADIWRKKIRKPLKISRSKILKRFSEISTPNYKVVTEKRRQLRARVPRTIWAHFGVRGRQENFNSRNEDFKPAKHENGRAYVIFAESNPTKMRISPIKLQGRMVVPRMVATSEKNVQLAFLNDQAKQLKSMIWKS